MDVITVSLDGAAHDYDLAHLLVFSFIGVVDVGSLNAHTCPSFSSCPLLMKHLRGTL
jgi:hypothetical protein